MKKAKLSLAAALMIFGCYAFAESAADIMAKSTSLPRPDYSQCQITVLLTDKSGATEERKVLQAGNNKNSVTQTTFDFRTPASYKDTRLLQSEKANGQDNKWIYLPSLRSVRQIVTADRKKDFVGTDFTYNDMTVRKAEKDEHTMLDENAKQTAGGKSYNVWKIKSVPVTDKNVEYSYRIIYVDKTSYLPVVTEFYDRTDKLLKVITTDEIEQVTSTTGKTYWMRKVQTAESKSNGHKTRISVDKFIFDKAVSDNYFTQNWLNTGKI